MNTPAHLVIGLAAFARRDSPRINTAAFAGSLLPDVSLYLLGSYALFVSNIPPSVVFGEMYFSDDWQRVFAVDNSVFLWGCILLAGWLARKDWVIVLGAAGLVHISFDFLLHHDDGRAHFWPLSDWIFNSPVSYWDPTQYGNIVGPIEGLVCLGLAGWMLLRFRSKLARAMIIILAALEVVPVLGPLLASG